MDVSRDDDDEGADPWALILVKSCCIRLAIALGSTKFPAETFDGFMAEFEAEVGVDVEADDGVVFWPYLFGLS